MACSAKLGLCPFVNRLLKKRVEFPRVAILVARIAKFGSLCLCETGSDVIGIRQANYPSEKGKQMHESSRDRWRDTLSPWQHCRR